MLVCLNYYFIVVVCRGFLVLDDKLRICFSLIIGIRPAVPTEFGEVQFNANFPPVPAAEAGVGKLTLLKSIFIFTLQFIVLGLCF